MNKDTIEFKEYNVKFDKKEFKNMSKEDLQECDRILKKIEEILS